MHSGGHRNRRHWNLTLRSGVNGEVEVGRTDMIRAVSGAKLGKGF
jgi:hypothetical protein